MPQERGSTLVVSCIAFLAAGLLPLGAVAAPLGSSAFTKAQVLALAVEEGPAGFVGTHAEVEVTVLANGAGNVYVSTKPLAQADMQGSARLASQVAAATLGLDWRGRDYLVSFTSNTTIIGGPSAGAVMTLGFAVALHNLANPDAPWTLDPAVAATGTINPDGTIGPVGGIPAKAEAAARAGIQTFLYPAGLDQATTVRNGRYVTVDMAAHCNDLGITCRPATTIADLLEAAAHVKMTAPDPPLPTTMDYAAALGPGVEAKIAGLRQRIEAVPGLPGYTQLAGAARSQVAAAEAEAQGGLDAATAAASASQYYSAATHAFKGAIASGYAERLVAFYREGRSEGEVTAALQDCQQAVQDAEAAVAQAPVGTMNALYAIGAAQQRVNDATQALRQARADHENAYTYTGWLQSLQESSFCIERAGTVLWWAALPSMFPTGPGVRELRGLAQDETEKARELVSYAQSVLSGAGGGGVGGYLQGAQDKLDQAEADLEARPAAAALDAAEAQTLAMAAIQLGGGASVPPSVLAAAQKGASQAIARARAAGAEPILSVSLVELAQAEKSMATALQEYWNARNVALLALETADPIEFGNSTAYPPKSAPSDAGPAGLPSSRFTGGATLAWVAAGLSTTGMAIMAGVQLRRHAKRRPLGPEGPAPTALASRPDADWVQSPPIRADGPARPASVPALPGGHRGMPARDPETGRWVKRRI